MHRFHSTITFTKLPIKVVTYDGNEYIANIIGKDALYSIIREDVKMMNQRQAWAEVSGKMEYLYNKMGGVPVPSKYVQDILKDKEIYGQKNDGHYNRNIRGKQHEKIIFGWIDPEIRQIVDNKMNESYDAVDIMTDDNLSIILSNVTDKKLISLFNESDRIISNFIDNYYPLRHSDINRLKQLKLFYFNCLFNDNISDKFKDYCEIEIDEINNVLENIRKNQKS